MSGAYAAAMALMEQPERRPQRRVQHHRARALVQRVRRPAQLRLQLGLRGALELAGTASRKGELPPIMPVAAPALKAALDIRERSCVCAALRLLILLLRAEPRCGKALRPYYKMLLPGIAAFKVVGRQPVLGDEVEYSQHRQINVLDLIDEALEEAFKGKQ